MAKKRIYVPVEEHIHSIIKASAKRLDRSEAYIASQLIIAGINFSMEKEKSVSK